MIEEILLNYGVAGAMLVYFIYQQQTFQKRLIKVIDNNTIALTRVYENMRTCNRK